MNDQAALLQRLAGVQKTEPLKFHSPFVVVTGGKGGVGKTSITANLAVSLAAQKKRVLLADLDLGLANLDVFFRLFPQQNLSSVVQGIKTIEECLVEGPNGIRLLPGCNGMSEFSSLTPEARTKILSGLAKLSSQYDFILADTAAGIAPDVLSFADSADRVLIVTTPEPAALTDAYALLKLLVQKRQEVKVGFVMNNAASHEEASQAIHKLQLIAQKFLNYSLECFGQIPRDSAVPRASREQRSFVTSSPDALASNALRNLSQRLIQRGR